MYTCLVPRTIPLSVPRTDAADGIRPWRSRMTPAARRHNAFVARLWRGVDLGDLFADASLDTLQSDPGEVLGTTFDRDTYPRYSAGRHKTAFGHFL